MKIWRAIASLLLSLTLVTQGAFALPMPQTGSGTPGSPNATRMAETRCHEALQRVKQTGDRKPACCHKFCPDMTTCALSQPASLSASLFEFPEARSGTVAYSPHYTFNITPIPRFRPPIAPHS